ncbi:trimeric intracellular cation channel family protein [Sphingorhabdus pulchriflava]|uniref:Trimeric intracellular cation channel family protein n=1 Tax=Sphingorhabdus pulchriflava TaxID=2292257 RepID=A0A371B4I3_9SPHN|nr:trimeric intracellular cation channel family protein [Sphingorhabdus pulchriflava]RDV02489.1 trimeric intracellular cation channel family protein [Sphingorhabdus pulchriflava]
MEDGVAEIAPALIAALDLFGIAVFAASGALAAARLKQTLVTFAFFALLTGVGGGTVRDLLIGAPVFWVQDWRFPATCLATALLVWLTPVRIWSPRALDWFDAVGLAVYSVFGAWKAASLGIGPLPAMMMGVITACVGGVIRDMLAGVPSIILRPELYVTASALAAGLYVLLFWLGMPIILAAAISAAAGFALRAAAIQKGLAIPAYKG